jgi:hypothetical protein
MKMNFVFKLVLCGTIFGLTAQTQNTVDHTQALRAPITLSATGIDTFLRTAFNNPVYVSDILPHDFSHFIQLLQHSKSMTQHRRAYVKSVIKLFNNKIKGTQYINAYAFSVMLDQVPDLFEEYFSLKRLLDPARSTKKVYTILEETFLNRFDQFKEKPREFLDTLSHEIVENLQKESELITEDISVEQLRQSIVRFLELCITKLVWSPEDHEAIWDSVKKISRQCEVLIDRNIISDSSDLDDLYWSLIHRFCFFVDITGSDLPIEFYEKIRNDIASQQLLLLELEEQEKSIEPKMAHLKRALFNGEAKKRALDNGIVARR